MLLYCHFSPGAKSGFIACARFKSSSSERTGERTGDFFDSFGVSFVSTTGASAFVSVFTSSAVSSAAGVLGMTSVLGVVSAGGEAQKGGLPFCGVAAGITTIRCRGHASRTLQKPNAN